MCDPSISEREHVRGKGMLKRITDAIACYRNTLEEEEVTTSEIAWTGLIDVETV